MTMTDEPMTDTSGDSASPDVGAVDPKAAKKAKKGRSNLLPALVLAAGIAAAGYFVGGTGASADAEASGVQSEVEHHYEPGEVIELEAMTVNLAGGRFLRVGLAVLATDEFDGFVDDGGTARFLPEHESRLRDQLIAMFAGRELGSLSGAENLEAIKAELLDRTDTVLDGHALEIYLTDFVTQ